MDKLRAFLETEGGKLAMVTLMLVFLTLTALLMHMTHNDPQDTGRTLLSHAFTSLMTLLLTKLSTKGTP